MSDPMELPVHIRRAFKRLSKALGDPLELEDPKFDTPEEEIVERILEQLALYESKDSQRTREHNLLVSENRKLERRLTECEKDFRERMDKALLVNEQRLDELSTAKARLAELEAERTGTIHESWQYKTHAELLQGLKWQGAITKSLLAANHELHQKLETVEARVDALMLEFCPDEMTEEQKANWAAHQRVVDRADPVIHAQDEQLNVWCGPRSQLPTGYVEVCTDAEYAEQGAKPLDVPYPQFCRHPDKCAGKGSCPRDPCCAE
jgi:hypothetical protein